MNMTATVEVNVWAVFSLLELTLTVNSIRDAMTLLFGDLNAHVRDRTASSGLINLLMRPMAGVSPLRPAVEGSIG